MWILPCGNPKGQVRMNIVEYALFAIKEEIIPVNRAMSCYEMSSIREIAAKAAAKRPGGMNGNLIFEAISIAYRFGFWMGWKHCEAESLEFDFDADQTDEDLTADTVKPE